MFRALYTAATGMQAQQTNLDTIANNLANSSTSGFQSRRMQFQDLIYQNLVMPGAAASQQTTVATGLQVGLGTRSSASEILQTQGDLAADRATRSIWPSKARDCFRCSCRPVRSLHPQRPISSGCARQRRDSRRKSAAARRGDPAGATSITIASDGTVSVTLAGQTAAQQVGSMQLALFPNPGGLNSVGQNLYLATTASGDPVIGTPGSSAAWDRSSRATWSSRTSAWSTSSST
jgi:flagellar basal-body rod protein FlgG